MSDDASPRNATPSGAPKTRRRGPLRGATRPPGDRGFSHRALALGLLTVGDTVIDGLSVDAGVRQTAHACRLLGARVVETAPGRWTVSGTGVGTLLKPREKLEFGTSRTGSRLMIGVIAGHPVTASFDGAPALRARSMRRLLEPLVLMGAEVLSSDDGRLPLTLKGAEDPAPIEYQMPIASPQLKSAVLLAGLNSPGRLDVIEKEACSDQMERMLHVFGADLDIAVLEGGGRKLSLKGRPRLRPCHLAAPADPALAAFPIVAALITPGSDIVVEDVLASPWRAGLIETLRAMGASIEMTQTRAAGGEQAADLGVRHGALRGLDVSAARAAAMGGDCVALAIAAAFADGETVLRGVGGAGWAAPLAAGLRACGLECALSDGDLHLRGRGRPAGGAELATAGDWRLALGFMVLGLSSERPVAIADGDIVEAAYPGFRLGLAALGAELE